MVFLDADEGVDCSFRFLGARPVSEAVSTSSPKSILFLAMFSCLFCSNSLSSGAELRTIVGLLNEKVMGVEATGEKLDAPEEAREHA